MVELLSIYSVEEIIIFIALLFFAGKEIIQAKDFIKDRKNKYFFSRQQNEDSVKLLQQINEKMGKVEKQINILTESDKDDIKSWLVEKYHFYKDHPTYKISDYTLDTIEKRYSHYKEEGGNSYIDQVIIVGLREMAKEEQRVKL